MTNSNFATMTLDQLERGDIVFFKDASVPPAVFLSTGEDENGGLVNLSREGLNAFMPRFFIRDEHLEDEVNLELTAAVKELRTA